MLGRRGLDHVARHGGFALRRQECGQRHNKEIESAKAVAAHYGVEQRFLDLGAIFADSDCSLLSHSSQDIPEESYADQLAESDGKPVSTYVPFRNGLFLSAAASMALSLGCGAIYYGAHHDDWAGNAYPDCSREFVDAMNRAIVEGTGGELHLCAPFVEMSKADIVARGIELGKKEKLLMPERNRRKARVRFCRRHA